jgi:hypothetical protein
VIEDDEEDCPELEEGSNEDDPIIEEAAAAEGDGPDQVNGDSSDA